MRTLALWLDMSHLYDDNTTEKVDFASVAVVVVVASVAVGVAVVALVVADAVAVGASPPTAALLLLVSYVNQQRHEYVFPALKRPHLAAAQRRSV
jgi:heme A synthase